MTFSPLPQLGLNLTLILRAVCLLTALSIALGQNADTTQLTVGIKEAKPFSFKNESGAWEGISVVLWRGIAEDIGVSYRFEERDLQGLLDGVSDGTLDVAVGALTVTAAREATIDFSHSFYSTGLGVVTRSDSSGGLLNVLREVVQGSFFRVLGLILVGLLIVTLFIRVFESQLVKRKPDKEGRARDKLSESLWWALVIMIGKNDSHPLSVGGRVLALLWMVASLFIASSLTAVITSVLTVSELQSSVQSLDDLRRGSVVSVQNSSSSDFLVANRVVFSEVESVQDALERVRNGEADSVVYDRPLLQFTVGEDDSGELQVLPLVLAPQRYAVATVQGSPWLEAINLSLLSRLGDEDWQSLLYSYLGEE